MSLATRCTACGTVFRVVQDQLRVSEGWVRCGRCSEVFNAVENLVDVPLPGDSVLPRDAADEDEAPRGAVASMRTAMAPPAPVGPAARPGETARDVDLDGEPAGDAPHPAPARDDAAGTGRRAGSFSEDLAEELADDFAADPDDRPGSGPPPRPPAAPVAMPAAAATARSEPLPSFLRQAERAARWRRPRVRAALAGAAVLGVLGLAAQVAHSYRDLMAARWPATAPVLAAACSALGCSVEPPRLIEALVVDSSGLLRVERSALYRLSVGLRNQAAFDVAVPALDLTLTDTQGRVIARRVLRAAELSASALTVPAGRELLLQGTLQAQGETPAQGIAGYTIELFYP